MSDTAIKVENLSKSAPKGAPHGHPPLGAISHQSGERYTALRDVLANGVKNVARHSPLTSRHQPFWARFSPRIDGERDYRPERRDFGYEPFSDPPPG